MKPSSLLVVALATALITLCTSFSSGKGASPSKFSSVSTSVTPASATHSSFSLFRDNTHYYWYLTNGDVYDGWYTISDEISRLEAMYGVYVDLSPGWGSTLLSQGFILYGTPHLIWPSDRKSVV